MAIAPMAVTVCATKRLRWKTLRKHLMQKKIQIKRWLGDIRFWIVALALIRLIGIANPPLEVSHSWRQTTVAMAARNFYEVDPNILYPRIDIGGDLTGITGMEFPLLNWLIYLLSLPFGFHEWYGRLINLVVSSLGCWYFYRLLKRFFTERHAFCATLLLCVTLWFAFARKVMPDTFSMSLVIMGLYYGASYLYDRGKWASLLAYALLLMAGMLSKLPSGYILAVLLLPVLDKAVPVGRKVWLSAATAFALIPVAWWYFFWSPKLVEDYGLWHFFMGKSVTEGASEIWHHMGKTFYRFYFNAMNYTGFALFLAGMVMAFIKRQKLVLRILGLAFVPFLLVMLASGETFYKHDYYVVPFVPVMAMVAGYGVSLIGNARWRVAVLAVVALENVLNHHSQFVIRDNRKPMMALEQTFDAFSDRGDLICINSGQDPTVMYFTHRKGWVASNEQLQDSSFVAELKEHGCRYMLVMKKVFGSEVQLPMDMITDNEDYAIYRL